MLLRRSHNEYENSASYRGNWINRGTLWWDGGTWPQWSGPHIFNLVKVAEVYASDDTTREARTNYEYDQQPA